jgi:hypothetical protein
MGRSIINVVIELVVAISMITYGLFNEGGVLNAFTAVNTTNFSVLGFLFTSVGPLIIGFGVILYALRDILPK